MDIFEFRSKLAKIRSFYKSLGPLKDPNQHKILYDFTQEQLDLPEFMHEIINNRKSCIKIIMINYDLFINEHLERIIECIYINKSCSASDGTIIFNRIMSYLERSLIIRKIKNKIKEFETEDQRRGYLYYNNGNSNYIEMYFTSKEQLIEYFINLPIENEHSGFTFAPYYGAKQIRLHNLI